MRKCKCILLNLNMCKFALPSKYICVRVILNIYFMCTGVLPVQMSVYHVYAWCPGRQKRLSDGVSDALQLQCEFWELDPGAQ